METEFVEFSDLNMNLYWDDFNARYAREFDGIEEWTDPRVKFALKLMIYDFDDRIIKVKKKDNQKAKR